MRLANQGKQHRERALLFATLHALILVCKEKAVKKKGPKGRRRKLKSCQEEYRTEGVIL